MKSKHFIGWLGGLSLMVAMAGCGSTPASNDAPAENAKANEKVESHATTSTVADIKPKGTSSASTISSPTASPWDAIGKPDAVTATSPAVKAADSVSPTPAPGMEFKKADIGMGEKGRGYGGGIITTPVKTYWTVKEHLALIQVEEALKLFKGNDSNGKGPKTSDEFMKKVIKENDIKLPELPEGQRYVYDPSTEELLVEQPKTP